MFCHFADGGALQDALHAALSFRLVLETNASRAAVHGFFARAAVALRRATTTVLAGSLADLVQTRYKIELDFKFF